MENDWAFTDSHCLPNCQYHNDFRKDMTFILKGYTGIGKVSRMFWMPRKKLYDRKINEVEQSSILFYFKPSISATVDDET